MLIALILSFQFVLTPVQAQVGEKPNFSPGFYATEALIAQQALAFSNDAEAMMGDLKEEGVSRFLQTVEYASEAEKKSVEALLKKVGSGAVPVFKRSRTGDWVMQVYGHSVSMSIVDLYKRQIVINGQTLTYDGESIESFEARVRQALGPARTSFLRSLWRQVAIADAQAMEPISALAIVIVAVAILGTALYHIHFKPKSATARLVAAAGDIKSKADACEGASQDSQSYDSTHALATSIANRSTLNSLTDSQLVLQNELRKNLEKPNEAVNCEESVRSAAQKIKIQVPTTEQLTAARERRQIRDSVLAPTSDTDVTGALLQMCGEYQRLASCMSQFVSLHVNNGETIGDFGGSSSNFTRYRGAAGR